ncbi:MAG: ATP-dependent DNA helicase RecG [Candidatus Marinimicrobia bacterium]|nr:ATP-dependent DNA helicase RecG [Candidatus Neomarinimicrobiota bacterium]
MTRQYLPDMPGSAPAPIYPTDAVQYVKGIGPVRAEALAAIGIDTVLDLLYYFPRKYLDRRNIQPISELIIGEQATVLGKVMGLGERKSRRGRVFQLTVQDDSGLLTCVWFRGGEWIKDKFQVGDQVALSGQVEFYRRLQMVHPDFDILEEEDNPINTGKIVPVYPGTADLRAKGLESRRLRRIMQSLLERLPPVDDPQSEPLLSAGGLMGLDQALREMHSPTDDETLATATHRLKFDEHFYLQLLMALRRRALGALPGRKIVDRGPLVKQIYRDLDFELTGAQIRVLREIRADFQSGHMMNRLLQGDVGSGKTVVALLAAAIVAHAHGQTAVMAPTEILAEQHYRAFTAFSRKAGLSLALLTGSTPPDRRKEILGQLKSGDLALIIGTHALIQDDVTFKDLAFMVIDEQHRFGVLQRGKLMEKGVYPHVLAMTATPIPRTLAITYHGDMDISILDERPANRGAVITTILSPDQVGDARALIRRECRQGHQAFIIYPLIEESEKGDLQAAKSGFTALKKQLPGLRIAYLDGKMSGADKDSTMQLFSAGEVDVLVSTTVVEVGIDVPNATVMVVENAERFGLTQLHQLRGRIGRGALPGHCLLVQRGGGDETTARLQTLVESTDGFEIADADLKLRGPGQLFGSRQHGFERLKLGNLVTDGPIIRSARKAAFAMVQKDPDLRSGEHRLLRQVLIHRYQDQLDFVKVN